MSGERRPTPMLLMLADLLKARLDRPVASHPNEDQFQNWYRDIASQQGLPVNPDDPSQMYDYRSAYMAGASPDAGGHWPSQFKRPGHPNEIVGGFNTRTGEPEPGHVQETDPRKLVAMGWDAATALALVKKVNR